MSSPDVIQAEQRSIAKSWAGLWVAYNLVLALVVLPVLVGNSWLMQNVRFVTEVAFAAFVANVCFLAGPGAEVMLSLFGMRGKVLRLLIFAGGTALAMLIAYVAMLERGPSVEMAVANAEAEVAEVIPALENYRAKHGQYPDSLQPLLQEYILNKTDLPDIEKHWNMETQPLTYQVSKDGARYVLWFGYRAKFEFVPGPDRYCHMHDSMSKRWSDQMEPGKLD